jgi:hypothetical protein
MDEDAFYLHFSIMLCRAESVAIGRYCLGLYPLTDEKMSATFAEFKAWNAGRPTA